MDKKIANYLKILETAPDNIPAFEALIKVYTDQQAHADLADLYMKKAERTAHTEQAPEFLLKAANLYQEELQDDERSIQCLRNILKIQPNHGKALTRLETMLEEAQRTDGLIDLYTDQAKRVKEPEQKADFLLKAALLWKDRLGNREESLDVLTRAHTLCPTHLESLRQLKQGYFDTLRVDDALNLVETEAVLLEEKEQAKLFQETALRLADDPATKDLALEYYERSGNGTKQTKVVMEELQNLDAVWSEVVDKLKKQADSAKTDETKAKKFHRIAATLAHYAPERTDEIFEAIGEALQTDEDKTRALSFARRFLDEHGTPESTVQFYATLVQAASDPLLRQNALARMAETQRDVLEDNTAALQSYRQLYELNPDHPQAFSALVEDFKARGDAEALRGFLDARIEQSRQTHTRADTHCELALLWQTDLDDLVKAREHYEKALELSPGHQDAVDGLIPIYEEEDRTDGLLELLPKAVRAAKDGANRKRFNLQWARILENLDREDESFERLAFALADDPEDDELYAQVEELAARTDNFELLVETLVKTLNEQPDAPNARDLRLKIATLYDRELSRYDLAEKEYLTLLEQEKEPRVLDALSKLYAKDENWEKLVDALLLKAETSDNPDEQRDIYQEAALVQEQELHKEEDAIGTYRKVLEIAPDEIEALRRLEELYEARDSFEELAEILLAHLQSTTSVPEMVNLHFKRGRILLEKLSRKEEAAKDFLAVVEKDAKHLPAVEQLESLLDDGVLVPEVFEGLEAVYRETKQAQKLERALDLVLAVEEDDLRRGELLTKLAEVRLNELQDPTRALEAAKEALNTSYRDESLFYLAMESARQLDRQGELIDNMEKQVRELDDEDLKVSLHLSLGQMYWQGLSDVDLAEQHFLDAAELRPEDSDLLGRVCDFLHKNERYELYAGYAEKTLDLLENAKQSRNVLVRLASVYENELVQTDKAVDAYQRLRELSSKDMAALDGLIRCYELADRFEELAETLSIKLDLILEEQEKNAIRYKLGWIHLEHLEDAEAAIGFWEEVVKHEPGHQDAVRRLFDLLQKGDHEERVAKVLLPVYEVKPNDTQRTAVLSVLYRYQEGRQQAQTALDVAALQEEVLQDNDEALRWYGRAFLAEPGLKHLETLWINCDAVGNVRFFLEQCEEKLTQDGLPDGEVIALRLRMADVYLNQLSDRQAAKTTYQAVRELEATNETALEALLSLAREDDDLDALTELLDFKRQEGLEKTARRDATVELADLCLNRLEDVDRGLDLLDELLAERENDTDLLDKKERVYTQYERWEELRDLLNVRLKYLRDDDDVLPVRIQLARLVEDHLEDADEAKEQYRLIVADHWQHPVVADLLDELFTREDLRLEVANDLEPKFLKAKSWERLATVYEVQIAHEEKAAKKRKLLTKLSGIYQDKLEDTQKAFEGFSRVFIADPGNSAIKSQLETLAGELSLWEKLAQTYEDAGKAMPEDDADEAIAILWEAAKLHEDILLSTDNAVRNYRLVLDRDVDHEEALAALDTVCRKQENWELWRDILLQRVDLLDETPRKVDLLNKVCALYAEEMKAPLDATPIYEQILALTPQDMDVVQRLLDNYTELEDWAAKVRVLEHKLDLVEEESEKNNLRLEMASLLETSLENPEAAKDLYKQVLDLDEQNEFALFNLEEYVQKEAFQHELALFLDPRFERREQWDKLIAMRQIQLDHAEDAEAKRDLLVGMADIYETKMGQIEDAYQRQADAMRLVPSDDYVRAELERLAGELSSFEALSELYDEVITQSEQGEDAEQTVSLLLDHGAILEQHLFKPEEAAVRYRRLLDLNEAHGECLNRLEAIYEELKDWDNLIDILERKFALAEDLEPQKSLLFRIANIYEDEKQQNAEAIDTYHRLRELDDRDSEVLNALVRLTTAEERWEDLIDVREAQWTLADDNEAKWRLRNLISHVYSDKLERFDKAMDLLEEILNENPQMSDARESLQTLMQREDCEQRAATIMAPLYRNDGQWDSLIHALGITARHRDQAEEARDLYLEMSRLAEDELADADQAYDHAEQGLVQTPMDEATRERLAFLAQSADRWTSLADAYRRLAESSDTDLTRIDLYSQAGRIAKREMDDLNLAEEFYTQVRKLDGRHAEALAALEDLFFETGQWEALVQVVDDRLVILDDADERHKLFHFAAGILEEELADVSRSIDWLLRLHGEQADDLETLVRLDRLFEQEERYTDLDGVLDKQLALHDEPAVRHELLRRKADLHRDHLNDASGAATIYAEILSEDDRFEAALSALEEMVSIPQLQAQALGVLDDIFTRHEDWSRLVGILGRQLGTLDETETRVAVLTRMRTTHEDLLKDEAAAFGVAKLIFGEQPGSEEAQREMERLAVMVGGFELLADTYDEFIARTHEDDALKIDLLQKAAQVHEQQLENPDHAILYYQQVLSLEPRHETAMAELDRLYEARERYADLVELIPQRIALLDNQREAHLQKLRIGKIWESKLGDNGQAIEMYREILKERPDHPKALAALERMYETEGMWEELLETLRTEVRQARGDTRKALLYSRMAEVLYENLNQPAEAIPLWNRVLQFDEDNQDARLKLEDLYLREEMWDDLIGHLKKQLRKAHGSQARADVTARMADVYYRHLKQTDQATPLYLKVLQYRPNDQEVIDTLQTIYVEGQQWRELIDLLTQLMPQMDGADKSRILLRLATIHIMHLEEFEQGEAYARQVLEADPDLDTLVRLEALIRDSRDKHLYADIIRRQATMVEETDTRIALYFRLADTAAEFLNDADQERSALESVLSEDAKNLFAAERLESIYERDEDWSKLVTVKEIRLGEATGADRYDLLESIADLREFKLEDLSGAFETCRSLYREDLTDFQVLDRVARLARVTEAQQTFVDFVSGLAEENQEQQSLWTALMLLVARWYRDDMSERDLAALTYEEVLESGQVEEEALDFLIDYYRDQERWDDLVSAYQKRLPLMDQTEKVRVGCIVAGLFYEKLDQRDRAVKTYHQVLKMDDGCEPAVDSLIQIYESESTLESLVEMLKHKLGLTPDAEEVKELRFRIAGIYLDDLNDLAEAKNYLRAIIAEDPKHIPSLNALERLYNNEENYDELLEVLSRRVTIASDDEEKVGLYRKMADIWLSKFGQRDMAVNYLERMLTLQPTNLDAILELENIYTAGEDWEMLVETYQRHIDNTLETSEMVQLYTYMGRVYGEKLYLAKEAIDCFRKALNIEEKDPTVLAALADLYILNENWAEAIDIYERMAKDAEEKAQRVEYLGAIGRLYQHHLNDPAKAKAVFDRMYEEDPMFLPVVRELRKYYRAAGEWDEFLRMIGEEALLAESSQERADVAYEEGRYYLYEVKDVDQAVGLFQRALAAKEDHYPSLTALGGIFFERDAWADAEAPLKKALDVLPAEAGEDERSLLHYRLAYLAEMQGNIDDALRDYTIAYKIDNNSQDTVEGLARALYQRAQQSEKSEADTETRLQHWKKAFRVYQTILVRYRKNKNRDQLVDLFCSLGEISLYLNNADSAIKMYEKALELNPDSLQALHLLVQLHERAENWRQVLRFRARLIKRLGGDELMEQWKAVGDIYAERMNEPAKALESYRKATEIRADDKAMLQKVADLLLQLEQPQDALAVMRTILSLETDPAVQLDMNLKLADLARTHSDNPLEVLDYWEAALDLDPTQIAIFTMTEAYLVNQQNWNRLDAFYRNMIQKLSQVEDSGPMQLGQIWRKLGDLLADRTDNLEEAIQAWEVVAQTENYASDVMEKIAELYARDPNQRDKAVNIHRDLLAEDPKRLGSYKALWKIAFDQDQFDRAFCYAGAAWNLGDLESAAAQFYSENLDDARLRAADNITPDLWVSNLLHHESHPHLGHILNVLFYHVSGMLTGGLKEAGLSKRDRVNLKESVTLGDNLLYVCKVLDIPAPEAYTRSGATPLLEILPMQPATVAAASDGMERLSKRKLMFALAVGAAFLRPDFLPVLFLDGATVRAYLDAAARLFYPDFQGMTEPDTLSKYQKVVDRYTPKKVRGLLQQSCDNYIEEYRELDINAWRESLILSAYRCGLLMCNDLSTATAMIEEHPLLLDEGLKAKVLADLLRYGTGQDYFELRKHLGLSLT